MLTLLNDIACRKQSASTFIQNWKSKVMRNDLSEWVVEDASIKADQLPS